MKRERERLGEGGVEEERKRGGQGVSRGSGKHEQRKDEANVSPGVGISGRCATALPGSHLWGQSPPVDGPPPCPRKARALRHAGAPPRAPFLK